MKHSNIFITSLIITLSFFNVIYSAETCLSYSDIMHQRKDRAIALRQKNIKQFQEKYRETLSAKSTVLELLKTSDTAQPALLLAASHGLHEETKLIMHFHGNIFLLETPKTNLFNEMIARASKHRKSIANLCLDCVPEHVRTLHKQLGINASKYIGHLCYMKTLKNNVQKGTQLPTDIGALIASYSYEEDAFIVDKK